jgi:hypothetical protein
MKTGQKEIIILKSNVDSFSDNGGIWKKYKVISAKLKRRYCCLLARFQFRSA